MFRLSTKSPFHLGAGREAPLDQQIRWLRREREREREPRKTPAEGGKTNEKRKQTGKMKTNPPTNQIHPPSANSPHPNKVCERERASALKRELPLCALHCGGNACSKPTRISLANWGKTFSFATSLCNATARRNQLTASRASRRSCLLSQKAKLATDRQLTTVWQVATSDSRQRATCNCVN